MSLAHDNAPAVTINELNENDGRALFERACQKRLGVSAETFLAAYDSQVLPDDWSPRDVVELEMLLPFAR